MIRLNFMLLRILLFASIIGVVKGDTPCGEKCIERNGRVYVNGGVYVTEDNSGMATTTFALVHNQQEPEKDFTAKMEKQLQAKRIDK